MGCKQQQFLVAAPNASEVVEVHGNMCGQARCEDCKEEW